MFSNLFQVCACKQAFELKSSGRIFKDVDECQRLSSRPYSQICINTEGSYSCPCHAGYSLEPDGHTCKATDKLELGTSSRPWVIRFEVLNLPRMPMKISLSQVLNAPACFTCLQGKPSTIPKHPFYTSYFILNLSLKVSTN